MPWENTTLNYPPLNVPNQRVHTYDVFEQPLQDDCIASSLVMLVKYHLGIDLALGFAHLRLRQAMHARLGNNAPNANNQWYWGAGGASAADALTVLNQYYNRAAQWTSVVTLPVAPANLAAAGMAGIMPANQFHQRLAQCTVQSPAMVSIQWNNGGGHEAICIGRQPMPVPNNPMAQILAANPTSPEIVFLDPFYGVVAINYANARTPNGLNYDTQQNSFNKAAGVGIIDLAIFS